MKRPAYSSATPGALNRFPTPEARAEPPPGFYTDSIGTLYEATKSKAMGWMLQKVARPGQLSTPSPFAREDFPTAVARGLFTYQPNPLT
ncbi:hypothetical protein [Hymenobacter ruber]